MTDPQQTISAEVNPAWLRIWHGLQALCFLGLLVSGLSLHYSDAGLTVISFRCAVPAHNVSGAASSVLWVVFAIYNFMSGNIHHYVPRQGHGIEALWVQVRYYAYGMFREERPPFPPGFEEKFNPVQKAAYVFVMYMLLPVSILTGWLLMLPDIVPPQLFGRSGLWPVAMLHLAAGWLLTLFVVFHIYLATTGDTVGTMYKEMVTGVRTSTPPPPPAP